MEGLVQHAALVSILCVALAGCGGGVQTQHGVMPLEPADDAQALLRSAIPALEAYYADNGTYFGVSVQKLRVTYDQGVPDVRFVKANSRTYCVEITSGGETASKAGPAADITSKPC
jgi:hypothetical protein